MQATARLSHWNTVEVFDYGRTEDGTFYYVMEYLPGLSLQELVDRHGPLPPGAVIYLLCQACDALREAHAAGLDPSRSQAAQHLRGLSRSRATTWPSCSISASSNRSRKTIRRLTREGTVTGSPLYMAPEQIMRTHAADRRTDIYAMGAIAYFLLTGRPPFLGIDSMAVMVAHARDPVVPPSRLRERRARRPGTGRAPLPRKETRDRYQDAESLARALSACADAGTPGRPVQAEAWWQSMNPGLRPGERAGVVATRPCPGHSPSDLTRVRRQCARLFGASELEAASEPGTSGEIELSLSLGEDETAAGTAMMN